MSFRGKAKIAARRFAPQLMTKQNVIAVGCGMKVTRGVSTGIYSVVCTVRHKLRADKLSKRDLIPQRVGGVLTDVVEGTDFVALAHTTKQRPAKGGDSIGHVDVSAGTLGCLVHLKAGGTRILSNKHVLAPDGAKDHDAILQPGKHDGGVYPRDYIGALTDFVPIVWDDEIPPAPCVITNLLARILNGLARIGGRGSRLMPISAAVNKVDAALAIPIESNFVNSEIRGIGAITGITDARVGLNVEKSGRTTELTAGKIEQTDVTVRVGYGGSRVATFTDQIMMGAMSEPGDSGSLVVTDSNRAVGLLFAGSKNSTIACRIQNVFEALGINGIR